MKVFIDPSPETPWASYTTFSGFDYRTQVVPEPSSLAIASCGLISLLAVGVRRWRRLT